MKKFSQLLFLMALPLGSAVADPVWDPTEIARLSQQAGQLATNLSAIIDNLRTFDKLATQIGGVGGRPAFSSSAPAALARYSALTEGGGPSASDATTLISASTPTSTQMAQHRQMWQAAFQQAAADGEALSQVASQDAGGAVSRSRALGSLASNAQDLRGDLQANSAVGLAVLSELGAVESVLALLLEQQSLVRLTAIANNGAAP